MAFRKREEKEAGGHQLRALRHSYLTLIENHINDLRSKGSPGDREEAQRCFESDARDRLKDLRDELGIARKDFWLSQLVVATVASVVTAGVAYVSGSPIPIPDAATASGGAVLLGGGILRENSKLAARRKAIMQQNPAAYLYQLQQSAG